MRPSGTHLYKRVFRPSVRPSVSPSVRMSVAQGQKPRFSAVFGHVEILYRTKSSTNIFLEPSLLLSRFTRLFVHLSLHICHMINTHRDTARTHRCPVGLVCFNLDHYAFEYWSGHQLVNFAHRQPISCSVSCFVLHSPQSCLILVHTHAF